MQTSAVLDGDEWVINGHKWFTSNGSRAAFVTVFAKTDPDAASPYGRFSAILVPTETPGYDIVRAVPTMGHIGGTTARSATTMCACPGTTFSGSEDRDSRSPNDDWVPVGSSTACAGSDRPSVLLS